MWDSTEKGTKSETLPNDNENLPASDEVCLRETSETNQDDVKCGFVVSGINIVNTSTIERRFLLPSSRVGMISSAYDVSAAVLGLIISFYGSGGHKPRLISMATVAMALGSFIMVLPHVTTDNYHWGEEAVDVCQATDTQQECTNENDSGLGSNLYLFLLGQILHGLGGTTLYTIGISLIDDSVTASSSPMYLGILYSFATLGPALGYLIGGQFLNIYVDFDVSESHRGSLTPDDPRWVGAWWLGYIFASVLSLLVAIPISAFGKELPSASTVRSTRVSQAYAHDSDEKDTETQQKRSYRDLPQIVMSLLKNPVFILLTLAGSVEGLSTSGFATFLPKLIQNQFGVSAAKASMYGGLVAVPGAAGGQLIGGLICKKWKLNVQGMLRYMMVVCLAAIILDSVVWIRLVDFLPNLNSACNVNCTCQTEYYKPICIKEKQKTFGLGVQWFVVRLVGTIPGPVLFGAVIDGSCLVWQEKCGENSSCWIYNNGLLSQNFFVILVSVKICTSLFFIIAFKIYKKPVCKNPLNGSVMVNIGSEGTDNQTEVDILSGSVGNGNNVT
ncbi:hypothetical protein KUTeg_000810 [Tegillarca granosa]|uniref:Solute carrier organic anion transporter family member n=1 Tax=Tegillarca granosa TaxID=220873 RepID=A0ABQ9FYN8_TEGGR|nr:hypothetical protein KUTeg_000810 [Tegillarca granosa]